MLAPQVLALVSLALVLVSLLVALVSLALELVSLVLALAVAHGTSCGLRHVLWPLACPVADAKSHAYGP